MRPLMRMSRYDTISINRKAGYFLLEPPSLALKIQECVRAPISGHGRLDERRMFLVSNDYPDEGTQGWREQLARGRERERARERGRMRLAEAWVSAVRQKELARKRAQTRMRKAAEEVAAWKHFVQTEQRQLQLRKDGQLARLLGEPQPGELPAILQKLAAEDRRQAERGLVALTSGGKTVYKAIDDLDPDDMPARIAANRLRTTWLKERRDGWLGRGEAQA
jgi:hypothetical protein